MTFEPFPKIARLNRECVITEKIDGTNAQLLVVPFEVATPEQLQSPLAIETTQGMLFAGSRTRWLKPTGEADNFGFAAWAWDNAEELVKLGPGRHFGEWWGKGIQRGYGLQERRFSLFNVTRWSDDAARPACCHVVPVLYRGLFSTIDVGYVLDALMTDGSYASPGYMKPEGIVVYHTAQASLFKVTIENDEAPKSKAA